LSIVKPQKNETAQIPFAWIMDERLSLVELGVLVKATAFNNITALSADFYATNGTKFSDPQAVLESALIQLERYGYLEPGTF
jgi:hypothetical protein